MATQPTLFTEVSPDRDGEQLARRSDPPTSQKAAMRQLASGKINSGTALVVEVLRRIGKPLTFREILALATEVEKAKLREPHTVCKQLTVLSRRGLISPGRERICTICGNEAREWELAEQGPSTTPAME